MRDGVPAAQRESRGIEPRSAKPTSAERMIRWDSSRGIASAPSRNVDGIAGLGDFEVHPLVPVECQPETIESRTEIGASGRHFDGRGSSHRQGQGHEALPAADSAPKPQAWATSASLAPTTGLRSGVREDSAVSTSFRPFPVNVMTIC